MCALKLTSALPPPQRDGANLYMTLHLHKVDDGTDNGSYHGQQMKLPEGWRIADANEAVMHICGAHPWQCAYLMLSNDIGYGTSLYAPWSGNCASLLRGGHKLKQLNYCLTCENRASGILQSPCKGFSRVYIHNK
jgi:hypothetical protein